MTGTTGWDARKGTPDWWGPIPEAVYFEALTVTRDRHIWWVYQKGTPRNGQPTDPGQLLQANLIGCLGEVVLRDLWQMAHPVQGIRPERSDLGGRPGGSHIQIRTTDRPPVGRRPCHLIQYQGDRLVDVYVLVWVGVSRSTGLPAFAVLGAMPGTEGQTSAWWLPDGPGGNGRPCYMIPWPALYPCWELDGLIDLVDFKGGRMPTRGRVVLGSVGKGDECHV